MRISDVSFRSWLRNLKRQSSLLILSALSMALLSGSLLVGYSVEESLKNIGFDRLGKARYIVTPPVSVSQELVNHFASLRGNSAAITPARAISVSSSGISLPDVMVYGVNRDFFDLYDMPLDVPDDNEIIINSRLADRLGLEEGMDLIINLKNDPLIPLEIPLSAGESDRITLTKTVKKIIANKGAGNFSINIGSQTDEIIYMNHRALSEELERPGRYSMVLLEELPNEDMDDWIRGHWTVKDLGLFWKDFNGFTELRSDNLFIAQQLVDKIDHSKGELISSGFLTSVSGKKHATPYSFFTSDDTISEGIIIGSWLSEDSGLQPGDSASITWWTSGVDNRLVEKQISLPVLLVLDDHLMANEKDRLPDFPGLNSSASCRLWDPGIPVDLESIRDEDEEWWNQWGASPRLILPLRIAMELNDSSYGAVTGIRFELHDREKIESQLLSSAVPSEEGYVFTDLYESIVRGSREGVDFSGLFTGLNFFLILSCLYLLYQSQVLAIGNRKKDILILKALGYGKGKIVQWFMIQFGSTITVALIPGAFLALLYQYFVIRSLNSIWSGAVAGTSLSPSWNFSLMFGALIIGWILSLLCALWVLLKESRRKKIKAESKVSIHFPYYISALVLIILAIASSLWLYFDKQNQPAAFFASGLTILFFTYSLFNLLFLNRQKESSKSIASLAKEEVKRNKSSVRGQFLLYSGSLFLLLTLALPFGSGGDNPGGTGGFSYLGETAMPFSSNDASIEIDGIDGGIVGLRKNDGDDASCLNLNRVFQPSILGIPTSLLEDNNLFAFSKSLIDKDQNIWAELDRVRDDGKIPAIADATVLTWNLKISVGDTMIIRDGKGKERELIFVASLASSIFQGNVLIGEKHFKSLYPNSSGYRVMLFENQQDRDSLNRLLKPWGSHISSTWERLEQFAQVEHNYLKIFVNLGFIALVLGSLGTGLHLITRIRGNEAFWSLLSALGFSDRQRWTWLFFQVVPPLVMAFFASAVSVMIPMIIWSSASIVKLNWIWFVLVIAGLFFFMLLSLFVIFRVLLKTSVLRSLRNS